MEFSYKISEPEFRRAWRLGRKASSRSSLKTATFWVFVMACLMLLYSVIRPYGHQTDVSVHSSFSQSPQLSLVEPASYDTPPSTLLERVGPFIVLAGVWILVVGGLVPVRLHSLYQKDPRMQGQFTVNITPDFIATENTAGTSSKSAWNVYDYWCEGKELVVLTFHSGAYSVLSLAGLDDAQRDELRGILSGALRKK